MLMWYIIFVLLILFTGGGLLYLGTRAAKFVPAGSTPKRRLLIGLSAVILIFAVIAWLINLMNAVVCLLHFVFLWLVCDFIFTLVRRFRKRPFKRYYAGYAATALSLAALAAGWYLNHRVWVTAYTIESEKAISDLRIVTSERPLTAKALPNMSEPCRNKIPIWSLSPAISSTTEPAAKKWSPPPVHWEPLKRPAAFTSLSATTTKAITDRLTAVSAAEN